MQNFEAVVQTGALENYPKGPGGVLVDVEILGYESSPMTSCRMKLLLTTEQAAQYPVGRRVRVTVEPL